MGQSKDHMIMVTGQQPRPLEGEPALGLEIRALRTGAVAARVVPDTRDMALRIGLHMAPEGCSPALPQSPHGSPDMAGQGMGLFVKGIRVLKDRLQGDGAHPSHSTAPRSIEAP